MWSSQASCFRDCSESADCWTCVTDAALLTGGYVSAEQWWNDTQYSAGSEQNASLVASEAEGRRLTAWAVVQPLEEASELSVRWSTEAHGTV
jgi:hypothetical protein